MTIKVRCPECTKSYTLNDDALGKKFRCKECGEVIRIPEKSRQKSRQNSASRSGTTQTRRKKVVKRRRRPAPVEDYDDYGAQVTTTMDRTMTTTTVTTMTITAGQRDAHPRDQGREKREESPLSYRIG